MTYSFPPDVQQMIDSRLATGQYSSADDILRDALRALSEEDQDLVAVRDAITAWRAGDEGTPLAAAFEEIRRSPESKGGK